MIKKLLYQLENIDPMPWHQATLLAIALTALIMLAIFGNYVDSIHG